jgi:hypothetical protein
METKEYLDRQVEAKREPKEVERPRSTGWQLVCMRMSKRSKTASGSTRLPTITK